MANHRNSTFSLRTPSASGWKAVKKISALGIFFFSVMLSGAEGVFPILENAPVVDGTVTASEWRRAGEAELKSTSARETERTLVYYGRDERDFYAAFICFDHDIPSLRRQHVTPEERDNSIWLDDSVELRFDPWNAPDSPSFQRHVIINANGIVYDAVGADRDRNFPCAVQTSILADRWQVEIRIPLQELCGYQPGGAELWRISFARNLVRVRESQTLTGSRERSFSSPEHFVTFRSGPENPDRPFTVTGISGNKLCWRNDSSSDQPLTGTLKSLLLDGTPTGEALSSQLTDENRSGSLEMKPGKKAVFWRFTAPGGYVLTWEALKPGENGGTGTVRFTARPLHKELWSKNEPGLARYGTGLWMHGFDEKHFLPIAMDFAIPWEQKNMLRIAFENRMMPFGAQDMLHPEWSDFLAIAPPDMKFILYQYSRPGNTLKDKDGRSLLIDPAAAEQWKANFLNIIKPYRDRIFAVTIGDEISERTEETLLNLLKDQPLHPLVRQMSETIRNTYGFGKFGPPESAADPNPFRWIAMRSFIHAEMIRLHKEFKEMLNREMPGVFLLSDDPRAGQSKIYDFADFTPDVCDIINHQLYRARHPMVADFSFLAKYVSDLSSVRELWPFAHVENYAEQYTPMETLEKLSEAVRGGATGFSWYLKDERGLRTGHDLGSDYFGAPERWQVEAAVNREMCSMPPLIRPEADCALFAATATARALPGTTAYPHRAQMVHSLLEIPAGVFFRYCNETTLGRNPLDPDRCKVVFVADAQFCSHRAFERLEQYVRDGGTLIVTDPKAFLFAPDGEKLPRERLLGILGTEPRKGDRFFQFGESVLPLRKAETWTIIPSDGSNVIAVYADGKPAAVKTAAGKGEVWFFGADFAAAEQISLPAYQTWFRELAGQLGLKRDQDIWRFRFPEDLIVPPKPATGKCLTGNFILFRNFKAVVSDNADVNPEAKYTYSLPPDAPAESVEVSLGKGKLTDRIRACTAGNIDGKKTTLADRLVGWSSTDGFDLTFDMAESAVISQVNLFYQGGMRDITVSVSGDGKSFRPAGTFPSSPSERVSLAVAEKVLVLPEPQTARYLRLTFTPASSAEPIRTTLNKGYYTIKELKLISALPLTKANLMLYEIELWNKEP